MWTKRNGTQGTQRHSSPAQEGGLQRRRGVLHFICLPLGNFYVRVTHLPCRSQSKRTAGEFIQQTSIIKKKPKTLGNTIEIGQEKAKRYEIKPKITCNSRIINRPDSSFLLPRTDFIYLFLQWWLKKCNFPSHLILKINSTNFFATLPGLSSLERIQFWANPFPEQKNLHN